MEEPTKNQTRPAAKVRRTHGLMIFHAVTIAAQAAAATNSQAVVPWNVFTVVNYNKEIELNRGGRILQHCIFILISCDKRHATCLTKSGINIIQANAAFEIQEWTITFFPS